MLPFISRIERLGLSPIALYGDASAARIAARQPPKRCFSTSPTSP
jgi:hypothetical protein